MINYQTFPFSYTDGFSNVTVLTHVTIVTPVTIVTTGTILKESVTHNGKYYDINNMAGISTVAVLVQPIANYFVLYNHSVLKIL